jgi:protein TonB
MFKLILSLSLLLACACSNAQSTDSLIVTSSNTKDTVGIFEKVEVEAEFPGGFPAWRQFLITNLNAEAPFKEIPKKTKHFQQTAVVQFIVCKDGSICEVKVVNDVLPSIKKEAERVIKKSGTWLPAQQNGRTVKAYRKQPITFVVDSK